MSYTIQSLFNSIVLKLKALYLDGEARAMTDRIFEHYFNLTPVQRVISGTNPVDDTKIPVITETVDNLLNHVPLQYVLGKAYFMEMEFEVNPSVLIPRPETEELVSLILKANGSGNTESSLSILDIGTGSGCIAISIKRCLTGSEVTAIDISSKALLVAATNAERNNTPIHFIQADILDQTQWDSLPEFDLIVSNPPYVTHSEKALMQRNVLDFEPHTALFVDDNDPLVFYRMILAFAQYKLRNEGSLWFEINEMFGEQLRNMALRQGFCDVNIIFDIRGKSRFLQCLKKEF